MMMMQTSPALVSLTVIAVPGCTMGNILLTIALRKYSGGVRGGSAPSLVETIKPLGTVNLS
jgi:hypothetical protein